MQRSPNSHHDKIRSNIEDALGALEQQAQALRWRLRNFAADEFSEELTAEVADLVVTVGEVAVLSGRFLTLAELEDISDRTRTRCSEAKTDSLAGSIDQNRKGFKVTDR